MEALAQYLAKEGRAILQAPAIFSMALILSAIAIWTAFTWAYTSKFEGQTSTISILEGRIKLRDDQIADYKDKLSGATPSEAKSRIDVLEKQIEALSPRRLTVSQKALLEKILSSQKGTIHIAQDMAAPDTRAFAADFAAAFQGAGWKVEVPMVMGRSDPPQSGLALIVIDAKNLRPIERMTMAALQAANITFDLQSGLRNGLKFPDLPPGFPEVAKQPDPDVELLLTTRSK